MKKRIIQATALLWMLFVAVSCFDPLTPGEIKEGKTPPEGKMFIKATLQPRPSDTKTVLDGTNVYWSEGDAFKVFNASNPDGVVFSLQSGSGGTDAVFVGDIVSGDGPFFYVYPAATAGSLAGNSVSVDVPPTQTYVANSFALGSCIAAGTSADLDNVSFKHVSGVLLLQLKDANERKISKINVYTKGAENLCGAARVQFLSDGPTLNFEDEQTIPHTQCVTLDCSQVAGGGVLLDNSTNGVPFYLALPVGVFSGGFYLEAVDKEGDVMVKYSGANPIADKKILRMAPFAFSPQYEDDFMLETVGAAAVTGVRVDDGESVLYCCSYDPGWGQFSYSLSASKRTVRIQNWEEGFALSLEMPLTVTPGTEVAVTVNALGNITGISSGTVSDMRVLKKIGNQVWLANGSTGYIMLLED